MGISRIPDPDFVSCKVCEFRQSKRVRSRNGKASSKVYCTRDDIPRELFGQKGCSRGMKRKIRILRTGPLIGGE